MLIELLVLLASVPAGYLIAFLTRDELKSGKKWFKILIIASIITAVWLYLTGFIVGAYTSLFITITTFISYLKSSDKKRMKENVK